MMRGLRKTQQSQRSRMLDRSDPCDNEVHFSSRAVLVCTARRLEQTRIDIPATRQVHFVRFLSFDVQVVLPPKLYGRRARRFGLSADKWNCPDDGTKMSFDEMENR